MTDYGLPEARDSEGKLQAVDHTFEFDGDEVTIKLVPPTKGDIEEYEQMDADVSASQIADVLDKHLVKPDLDPEEMTGRELNCYVEGIFDYSTGGGDFHEAVQAELEKRAGEAPGNEMPSSVEPRS